MSNPIHPSLAPAEEKVKALQYLFDLARSANAPAAVHEQARLYGQFLSDSFVASPPPAAKVPSAAEIIAQKIAEAQSKQAAPAPAAETPVAPVVPFEAPKTPDVVL